jgi:hypothetical protein
MKLIDCEKINKKHKKQRSKELLEELLSPSKFKQLAAKKVDKKDWCPKCSKDFKWFGSSDDYFEAADNSGCPDCGLKREKYVDEYNQNDVRWPEPFTNVIDFKDAWCYIEKDFYEEDWDYD